MCKFIFPKISFNIERWQWNDEYRVFVSNYGHFKDEHKRNLPIKVRTSTGYCSVETAAGWKVVHRLVLLTWKPIPNAEDLTVDHLDHNKRNNRVDNLEWVTQEENVARSIRDLDKTVEVQKTKWYIAGKHKFNSLDAAINFVITKQHLDNTDTMRKTIEKRILNAITQKSLYCGLRWGKV